MNSSGGKTPSTARPPAYKANALAMIRNELSQFANSGESSPSGQQSPQPPQNQQVSLDRCQILLISIFLIPQSSSQSQNIDREVLLIRQMLSQVGVAGFDVSPTFLISRKKPKKKISKAKTATSGARECERMFM